MILPPSHSPAKQDHAMKAARIEDRRGEIPMEQVSCLPFNEFPNPGVWWTNVDIIKNVLLAEAYAWLLLAPTY